MSVCRDTVNSVVNEFEQNLSESADVRKYFQLITDDGKQFSKCLIKNCMRRIAGNHLHNLKRHLKAVHDAESNPLTSDDDDDDKMVNTTDSQSCSEGTAGSDYAAGVRQHYRCIIENGKLYSKCLIRGCKRRFAGNHLHNLRKHLKHGHNLKINLKLKENLSMGPQKFFQRLETDGKLFSKCLIKDCESRLDGDDGEHLESHLVMVHNIITYSASTVKSLSDDGQLADDLNVQSANEDSIESDSVSALENATDKLTTETFDESIVENTSLLCKDSRKYFQCITQNGKSYSRCLIRNCSRRIDGIKKEKLTRHLCIAHKMSSEITDARTFFKSDETDGKLYSVCLIQNCTRRIVGKHLNSMKQHLRGAHDMIIKPSCREMKPELEDARKYFENVMQTGKLYSKCLIDDCDCRIAGNHLYNLKRHLEKQHNIHIIPTCIEIRNDDESDGTTSMNDGNQKTQKARLLDNAKTCRLCFERKENTIDIFSEKSEIASVIRLHISADEVNLLVTLQFLSHFLIYFDSRSVKMIRCRNSYAQCVGRIYRTSISFIWL